jgi:hypothetical protein
MQLEARDYQYPEHVWSIREIREVQRVVDLEIDELLEHAQSMSDSLLIDTADAAGLSRYEKILGLTPLDTDSLDDRRYAVKLKYYDTFPYTEADLRARLDRLTGGGYELTVDPSNGTVSCLLALTNVQNLQATEALLEELIPLHICVTTGVRFNTYGALAQAYSTYAGLTTHTHEDLRTEVV